MPRSPANAAQTSLYRLLIPHAEPLLSGVQEKYLASDTMPTQTTYDFMAVDMTVGDRPALFVYGSIQNEQPGWLTHAHSLTGQVLTLANITSAGLLLLRLSDDADVVYAVSWGMGHLIFDQGRTDHAFGLRLL